MKAETLSFKTTMNELDFPKKREISNYSMKNQKKRSAFVSN